jgi:hypothetical protein
MALGRVTFFYHLSKSAASLSNSSIGTQPFTDIPTDTNER